MLFAWKEGWTFEREDSDILVRYQRTYVGYVYTFHDAESANKWWEDVHERVAYEESLYEIFGGEISQRLLAILNWAYNGYRLERLKNKKVKNDSDS